MTDPTDPTGSANLRNPRDPNEGDPADLPPFDPSEAASLAEEVIDAVEGVIVGHRDAIEDVIVTVLARGHLLIEDVPGVGKTTLAKAIARSFDASFKRVQFTPDLLPSDVTGVNVFNQRTERFDFRPGPVFATFVLGDEINRAPPKTQSALLEAMEERQVTTDGVTRALPDPFCVIATQNDVEPGQTYELPVAELDRFTKKIRLGYPGTDEEVHMLGRMVDDHAGHPVEALEPVASVEDLLRARRTVAAVEATESLRGYVARIASYTRRNATLGVSPRGSLALLRAAQARAVLNGRDYVIPDDVQREASSVLVHRIRVESGETSGRQVVVEALDRVDVEG